MVEGSHVASLLEHSVSRRHHESVGVRGCSIPDHPAPEIVHAAKCELAEKTLRLFGSLRLRVTGFSMLPSVWPGDVLLIRGQQIDQVYPGDIVLFARHGRLIAHRVVLKTDDLEAPRLVTQGDALPSQDSPISSAQLLGKVSGILRAGEWVQPARRLSFGARTVAMLLSRSGRAIAILARLRASRRRTCEREALCQS